MFLICFTRLAYGELSYIATERPAVGRKLDGGEVWLGLDFARGHERCVSVWRNFVLEIALQM